MFRFSINGAFRYLHGVRFSRFQLKHTGPALNDSVQGTHNDYWFMRNDTSITPLQKEPSLPEIVSFDDFGVLSLDRSVSSETVSTLGETSFLDNLLRNETYNSYDGYIPTTVDIKEMGGSGEVVEQLEIVLSEEFVTEEDSEVCTLKELKAALYSEDMVQLRKILGKPWPSSRELLPVLNHLFNFLVQNSKNSGEALTYFQKLASNNRRGFVKDEIVLDLALRTVGEESPLAGVKVLKDIRRMFRTKAPMSSSGKVHHKILNLYKKSFEKGSVEDAREIFNTITNEGYSTMSVGLLLRAAAESAEKESTFELAFNKWSQLATCYGNVTGSEYLLGLALANPNDKNSARQIGDILKVTKLFKHPYANIADMICIYIKNGSFEKAECLLSKLSVSGKYFHVPVRQFSTEKEGSKYIELFAQLISKCMYGEKSRGGGKKESKKEIPISLELMRMIDSQCRTSFTRPVKQNEKFVKDKKKKLCRVDEEQLNSLSKCIVETWLSLAESEKSYDTAQRMMSWCLQHRIEITEKLSERVSQLKK